MVYAQYCLSSQPASYSSSIWSSVQLKLKLHPGQCCYGVGVLHVLRLFVFPLVDFFKSYSSGTLPPTPTPPLLDCAGAGQYLIIMPWVPTRRSVFVIYCGTTSHKNVQNRREQSWKQAFIGWRPRPRCSAAQDIKSLSSERHLLCIL